MAADEPFAVFDCSLARCASGRSVSNLRELLDAIRTASDGVLEHHMLRCVLEDHFELYEFPNDIARWCWEALGEGVLGEEIALIDPYHCGTLEGVRGALADAIEARLWTLDRVPWCRAGFELHLVESRLIAFDTGERISDTVDLVDAIARMPARSLFYHVHEARRRTGGAADDFSLWLEARGADQGLIDRVRGVDFYFLNLNQLRQELLQAFSDFVSSSTRRATQEVA